MEKEARHETVSQLLALAKRGDKEAMNALLSHYRKFVLGVAFGELVGIVDIDQRTQDAEDVTQDVLVYAWQNIGKCSSNFRAWLRRIAKRDCVDVIRKREQRKEISLERLAEAEELADEEAAEILTEQWHGGAFQLPLKGEARLPDTYALAYAIRRGIALLPPMQQAVMKLRRVGYRHQEIAEILGIERHAAELNLGYARRALEAYLASQGVV